MVENVETSGCIWCKGRPLPDHDCRNFEQFTESGCRLSTPENVESPADRLARCRPDPDFPGQVYDPEYGRWCHSAEDLYHWLTAPENVEEPCEWCVDGFVEDLDNEGESIRCPECTPENVDSP